MDHTPSPYRKLEEQILADADRRKKEDLDAKAQLEYEQAKIERDREKKLQDYDAEAKASRKELEDEQTKMDQALVDRHQRELEELRQRQEKQKQERTREKENAIHRLDKTAEKLRTGLVEDFKEKYEDLIAKFQKDQIALAKKRQAEDIKRGQEFLQAATASTLSKQAGSKEVQSSQSLASLPVQANVPEPHQSQSSSITSTYPAPQTEDIPRGPRDWTSTRDGYRSGRSKSPTRGRYDRSDHYSSSYYRPGEYRQRSPPYSPRYSDNPGSSYRPGRYYDSPRRPRSRSPTRRSFDPPGHFRNWSRHFSPQLPSDRRVYSDPTTIPNDNQRRRDPSPLNTMNEDMHNNLPSIPTGPRDPTWPSRRTPRLDPPSTALPPSGLSQPNIAANRQPARFTPFDISGSGQSNYLISQTQINNAPVPSANTQILPASTPMNSLNHNGIKPVGFWVRPNPAVPGTKSSLENQFPVQRVKYIEENGTLYEWIATLPLVKPIRKAELRQVNNSYKGFLTNRRDAPSGWSIREHTVARVEYCTRWAVIRVVKLKQEDVGPKELWVEFKEPKAEVLAAFLKSFKNIPWTFYKVYPQEMPESRENPMDAALVPIEEESQSV